ncbi:hypothetical protein D3C74_457750 [compost metagenome]
MYNVTFGVLSSSDYRSSHMSPMGGSYITFSFGILFSSKRVILIRIFVLIKGVITAYVSWANVGMLVIHSGINDTYF